MAAGVLCPKLEKARGSCCNSCDVSADYMIEIVTDTVSDNPAHLVHRTSVSFSPDCFALTLISKDVMKPPAYTKHLLCRSRSRGFEVRKPLLHFVSRAC